MTLEILDIAARPDLKPAWRALFDGYSTFYKRQLTDPVADAVWAWLTDPLHEVEGRLALVDGAPVGLAHFRRQPRTGFGEDMGYLDDLFVSPDARSGGVGRALIEHVREVGRGRGWRTIRWTTADDNYRARTLYDQLAAKTSWNLYELTVGDTP
ncbi:GNAT family N-acetyltransferase [Phenylobacterium aquaticum]|uniref:GNAT family N-acetyltransferase n=1 Tax=Phenylobacterium aquaticum TaxID=1763816 RepID=UPI0026EAB05D|nr:GNAT family N-acetyltransferase [Phenylobacterium aquaticum]